MGINRPVYAASAAWRGFFVGGEMTTYESHILGHREFVGGEWERVGRLMFEWMLREGLKPHHYFLDAGCGGLRCGVHFIPYLDVGHYWGLDKRQWLLDAGLECELDAQARAEKQPRFIVNAGFDLGAVPAGVAFDYVLAASLFTHLRQTEIQHCVEALLPRMASNGRLYATYFRWAGKSEPQIIAGPYGELYGPELDEDWFAGMVQCLGAEVEPVSQYGKPELQEMLCVRKAGGEGGSGNRVGSGC